MKRIGSILIGALSLAACGSDEAVSVDNVWARASAPSQTTGAVYFDLTVPQDDVLVAVSVPASVAGGAEIHEVVTVGATMDDTSDGAMDMSDDEMSTEGMSMDMADEGSGQMRMQEMADGLALTGGETVSFEPGSYHVMLLDLPEPLVVGGEFDLTLDFANEDDVTVNVEVAETAP